jgi:hypothetical protein
MWKQKVFLNCDTICFVQASGPAHQESRSPDHGTSSRMPGRSAKTGNDLSTTESQGFGKQKGFGLAVI